MSRPVDADRPRRGDALRLGVEREQAFPAQPLVDADAAVEPFRAVVGDDEDERLVVGVAEESPDQPVDVLVVVEDRVRVRAPRLVLAVLGVHVLPEAVVDPVGAHLDEREQLPGPRLEQVLGELEAPVGHRRRSGEQPVLVVGAEVRAVEEVLPDDLGDLVAQRRRVRVAALDRRA